MNTIETVSWKQVALQITKLILKPDDVREKYNEKRRRDPVQYQQPWNSISVAEGLAGTALLLAPWVEQGKFLDEWQGQLVNLTSALEPRHLGLFEGFIGGMVMLSYAETCGLGRFAEARKALRDYTVPIVREHLAYTRANWMSPNYFAMADLISGAAGMVVANVDEEITTLAAEHLSWLAEDTRRLWQQKPGAAPSLDYGMAHGLAGLLSAATELSCKVGRSMADTFFDLLREANRGTVLQPVWAHTKVGDEFHGRRATWCYGQFGVAAALFKYARIVGSQCALELALNSLSVAVSPSATWTHALDVGLCHGALGNALVLWRVGTLSGDRRLVNFARRVCDRVVRSADASIPGLYRFRGFEGPERHETRVDDFSFLTGSCGVALAILTMNEVAPSNWLSAFGLP